MGGGVSTLQTLDRGLAVLGLVAAAPGGLAVPAIAEALGVHKAIAYRLVATLQAHGMVWRCEDGRVMLGAGVLGLAARFQPHFRAEAAALLAELTRATGCTSCIALAEGEDCVVVLVQEAEEGPLRFSYRIGLRQPLTRGAAAGLALLAGRAETPGEAPEVRQTRIDGYALTHGQLHPGASGLAVPVLTPDMPRLGPEPCVAVISLAPIDVPRVSRAAWDCAARLRSLLAPGGGRG